MQLVLLCAFVLSFLQPGLLQDGRTEDLTTNGGNGDVSQSITELKNAVLHFSHEVRGQLATINATVNTLKGQLESLKEEVVKNRQNIHLVRMIAESEQAASQNRSLQLAKCSIIEELSSGLNQLRIEIAAKQQMIGERVDGVQSQQVRIQNDSFAQLQIVHTNLESQLVNATNQLSTELNQLRRELTTNQQSSDLAHNDTQEKNISLQGQCQQITMNTPQDSSVTPGYTYTCADSPGWHRVAFLDMTDPNQDCPSGWNLTTHSVRTCGRASSERYICDPVTFSVSGKEYSRVCGRIRAYQYGTAWAFRGANNELMSLNSSYVDGISITHGLPQRQHIWTFAAGLAEEKGAYAVYQFCYCDVEMHTDSSQTIPPMFVGNDYYCESGVSGPWRGSRGIRLYSENPLWDGQNCGRNSACCSMNNPPYFMKDLPAPTTDDIEVRLCSNSLPHLSDLPIELLEIYVQ